MNDVTSAASHALAAAATQPEISELASMPIAIGLYLDDRLYKRVSEIALRMSKARGCTPRHLVDQPEACFAVVSRAITWRLDPFAVALATYQTPGGSIGYEGKLVHAIIENSGRLKPDSGGIRLEYFGDWNKLRSKFAIKESAKKNDDGEGRKYAVPTWGDADAVGLGVKVSATLRGESAPREYSMDLLQCQPRNSTLWATDPKTQMGYAAIRRFASVCLPGIMMGVPLDVDDNMVTLEREVQGDVIVEQPTQRAPAAVERTAIDHPAAAPVKSHAQETVDKQTGEVTTKPVAAVAQEPPAAQAGGPPALLSDEQRRFVAIKLQRAALTEADMLTRFKFDLATAPAAMANAILKWIDDPMPA